MRKKRREVKLKNHPGVYRLEALDEKGKWKSLGRYRAIKRIIKDGKNIKESAVFDNVADCVAYRRGEIEKGEDFRLSPKLNSSASSGYTFGDLFNDWNDFSSMKNRNSTAEFYKRCSKHLRSLSGIDVEKINASTIDKLIGLWKSDDYPKPKCRINFERELDLLKTILNFYKSRTNPSFLVPVFEEHYTAGEVKKSERNPLQHVDVDGFIRFLDALGTQKNSQYKTMATTQFGLFTNEGVRH